MKENLKLEIDISKYQLNLIERVLEFYMRLGLGQFNALFTHPSLNKWMEDVHRPRRSPKVGDRTPQGEILEIKDNKALINGSVKEGIWSSEKVWLDLENVNLSPDYDLINENENFIRRFLKNMYDMPYDQYGILNEEKVHNDCRVAYDLIQVIRNFLYSIDDNKHKLRNTVSASPALKSSTNHELIKLKMIENDKK